MDEYVVFYSSLYSALLHDMSTKFVSSSPSSGHVPVDPV